MPIYEPPIRDLQFVLHDVLNLAGTGLPGHEDLDRDFTGAVLDAAGKLAAEVLAPLNRVGDQQGCRLENGVVRTPEGFGAAFEQVKEGGWTALDCDPEYGGQGMPYILGVATGELFVSANMAFNMYQGLTHGAYSAIHAHGTDEQKRTYLPKMVSCDWTGTMNLTEPHCGTDLGLLRTKAEPQDDGSYLHHRPEDLHLGGRSRHGRERHPPGSGKGAGRRRRHEGHQPLHRAEVPGERGRLARRTQRRHRRRARAQDGHPRQLDLRDEL